jgi:hypothetical protein
VEITISKNLKPFWLKDSETHVASFVNFVIVGKEQYLLA